MKILVIGSGGREHALAKKFMESPQVEEVFVAPGNSGMEKDGIQIVDISELSNDKLVE
ncbi:MAG: phosphoribosylamine--glycine ligase N-terminal domain-containing protein, partial [Lactococcus lactis]